MQKNLTIQSNQIAYLSTKQLLGGLSDLLNLVLVKHGEDVAGGALGPLLRGSPPAGSLAGRHFGRFKLGFLV